MTNFNLIEAVKAFFSVYNRCFRAVRRAEKMFGIEVSAEQWGKLYDLVQANPTKLIHIRENRLMEDSSVIPNRFYVGHEYVSLETKVIDMTVHGFKDLAGLEITPSKTTIFVRTKLDKMALEHCGNCLVGYHKTDKLIEARHLHDANTEIVVRH